MLIEDEGIIISKLKYGENSLIVKVFTKQNGVCCGLIKGIKKYSAIAQVGNLVKTSWKGRLTEHLGSFTFELLKPYAQSFFDCYTKMLAINSSSALLAKVLPEKEEYKTLYNSYIKFLDVLETESTENSGWIKNYILLELDILKTMGFGLDLTTCVATGQTNNLAYISPKSGAAVCLEAGEAYKDKLFFLPSFFKGEYFNSKISADNENIQQKSEQKPQDQEILEGLRITRYFMAKYLFAEFNYSMPNVCHEFFENIAKKNAQNI
jgi:DNA repair protein RecO (recombination protein O)